MLYNKLDSKKRKQMEDLQKKCQTENFNVTKCMESWRCMNLLWATLGLIMVGLHMIYIMGLACITEKFPIIKEIVSG